MDIETNELAVSDTKVNALLQPQTYVSSKAQPPKSVVNEQKIEKNSNTSISKVSGQERGQVINKSEIKDKLTKKKKYHNITNDLRLKLIDAVENKGEKIKDVAKRLSINYSSAKSICQIFKREGRTNKKSIKNHLNREEANVNSQNSAQKMCFYRPEMNFTINHLITPKIEDSSNSSMDTLTKLKNRLLERRNSSVSINERIDYPPNKKLHIEEGFQSTNLSNEAKQLEQLDQIIAQNNQILTARFSENPSNLSLRKVSNNLNKNSTQSNNTVVNLQNLSSNINSNPQMVSLIPKLNENQQQNFNFIPIASSVDPIKGFIIANPSDSNIKAPYQQILVNSGINQMQLVMNPTQGQTNISTQQGYPINLGGSFPQGSSKIMVMSKPNQNVLPPNVNVINTSSIQGQQLPIFIQNSQFLNAVPQGYTQAQPIVCLIPSTNSVPNQYHTNSSFNQKNIFQPQINSTATEISIVSNVQPNQSVSLKNMSHPISFDVTKKTISIKTSPFLKNTSQKFFEDLYNTENKDFPQGMNSFTKKVLFEGNQGYTRSIPMHTQNV